jgi:ribosomal protein S4
MEQNREKRKIKYFTLEEKVSLIAEVEKDEKKKKKISLKVLEFLLTPCRLF